MDNKRKATIYDYARMCNSYDSCQYCPLSHYNNSQACGCIKLIQQYTDEANEIVLKWCDRHAVKSYADNFFEKFPNAEREDGDIPTVCRNTVYGITSGCLGKPCKKCWKEKYEE